MADIIELWTTKRDTPKDRWTVLHVYGQTGGVEVARCTKEGRPGWLYLIGMCSAAFDTDVLAEVPDTPEGVAILDFVAPATLRAIDLAVMDAAAEAGDAA
ncbi:hypothetical protein [Methylobacterium platani]|uniref:Uncharacterized protein n=2 Tax=Methylobacterium platani TaxID=427683 RepID=A0A179SEF3_9HYPH|nr:hypothetical protein [Methylobacterium platani]KMO20710.1 hypothetical protein SQ03_05005 [Methylobacterium platani JCM 14648]OAS25980.1 hypothetical protein A5481_07395 [Methylobacterium platani]